MTHLTISLLGPLQVTLDGEQITDFATDKARALLAYLAVEAAHHHRRDVLAGLLWPDQPQRKARQNLRQALSHLRQAIGDQDETVPFLLVSRETIQFNTASDYWLDVAAFTDLVGACKGHRHRRLEMCLPCLRRMERMATLYRGEFLEQFFLSDSDLFEEWALLEREWLRREVVKALSILTDYYERRGDYEQARHYAWQQVALEPWREEAHRQLMRLLALDGQRSAALAQYETCRRALAEELGVEPTNETVALYEQIRAAKSETGFFPKNLVSLPPSPTPFVGREEELAELAELLANPDCRLVTLTGPGGIGKTRLALQAAADQIGAFAHGVCFVPLAAVSSAEHLVPAIADALDFPFDGHQDPKEQLLNYLREKEILLVLDSMEHILEGAGLLAEMLKRAPGVVLLATSRERLNLREEWVYAVEGLTYPEGEPVEGLEDYSAINLFQQRARQAYRRFSLSETETSHVVRICRLVEGMPLGVELAAAWVAVRSCGEIAQEIEHNLDVLTTSLRNVPARQQSVRATFEYSWNLLAEPERQVFRKLSVFRGGFRRDAAEQVAGASLPLLSALVDKSLLRRDPSGRYQVHELLRQYAAEKLQQVPKEQERVQARHSSYYTTFLQQQEEWLQGGKQKQALEEIGTDIENVRAGWRRAVAQEKVEEVARCLKSLGHFYEMRSWYQEGAEAFSRAVEGLEGAEEPGVITGQILAWQGRFFYHLGLYEKARELLQKSLKVLRQCGAQREMAFSLDMLAEVFFRLGDYPEAERLFRESLASHQVFGDRYGMARSLSGLGDVAAGLGEHAETKRRCEEGLAICREIEDLRGVAAFLSSLGGVAGRLGEYAEAQRRFRESLAIFRETGDQRGTAACLHNLSTLAYLREEYVEAKRLRQETLAICREIGYRWGIANSLKSLGDVARRLGEYEEAKRLLQESLAILEEMGDRRSQAFTLNSLGIVAKALGDYQEARQCFQQALETAIEIQALPIALDVLEEMAELMVKEGETERAMELIAFILHHPATEEQTKDQAEHLRVELVSRFPPRVVTTARKRGESRRLEEVVEDACA